MSGPWRRAAAPNDPCCHVAGVEDAKGHHICDVADEENVALFVAAPDLYEALDALVRWVDANAQDEGLRQCSAARAALAKARGDK